MHYFYAVAHKDEDSSYGLTFPTMLGLFAAADELDGLVPAAVEALSLWFEDAEFVPPASLATVRELAAADLADGAFLVAVPWVQPVGLSERVNITLDKAVLAAIDAAAAHRHQSRSGFISDAAREAIGRI
jgi:predicted RNase H-like HicB family nuclease